MASKGSNTHHSPPTPVGGNSAMMSVPSAVIAIILAFVGGVYIGNITGRRSGGEPGEEIAAEGRGGRDGEAGAGGPSIDDDVDRVRIDVTDEMPQQGPADALVTVVLFSDFQCPFCSRVNPTFERIREHYGDDVRIVWRDTPLPFHNNATPAAEAAREAFAQRGNDGFWRMHEILFENQGALERANLESYAERVGLDMARFRRALDEHTHVAAVEADTAAGRTAGVTGTPAMFINGRSLVGAQPYEQFQTMIDEEVRAANAAISGGRATRANYYAALMRGAPAAPAPAAAAPAADAPPARRTPDPNAVYNVPLGTGPVRGPADALVTIVIVSEFQCPFCNRVRPTLDRIAETYGNDVRFAFRNNPLPFHNNAMPASEAAMEAFAQRGNDGFWAMHDLMFENQANLDREHLEQFAGEVGLDMARFRRALDEHTHQATIEADQTLARNLGASGTPSFFINGRNLRGAQPFEAFQTVIDAALAAARERVAAGTPRARVYETTIAGGATAPVFLPGAAAEPAGEPAEDPNRVYNIPVPANAPSRGGARAEVVIQIFSDFQCPFCSRVVPTVEALSERYGDRVRWVWRNYPLPFHNNAGPAAEAAMEAYAQRGDAGFWAMHDLLFENQRELGRETLERLAGEAGLDMARFRRALDEHTHQASIDADMNAVRTAGASIGTPSFFINGRLLQGAQPEAAFTAAIDRALAE